MTQNMTMETPTLPKRSVCGGMGKREPHRCEHCGDEVLMWRNCRKLECIQKRGEVA